jgi:hypothetical protein
MAVQASASADAGLDAFRFLDLGLAVELELGPGWILDGVIERASRYAEVFWLVVDPRGEIPDLSALPRTLTVYIPDGAGDVQIPVKIHDVTSGASPRGEILFVGLHVLPGICRVVPGARRLGCRSAVWPVSEPIGG